MPSEAHPALEEECCGQPCWGLEAACIADAVVWFSDFGVPNVLGLRLLGSGFGVLRGCRLRFGCLLQKRWGSGLWAEEPGEWDIQYGLWNDYDYYYYYYDDDCYYCYSCYYTVL